MNNGRRSRRERRSRLLLAIFLCSVQTVFAQATVDFSYRSFGLESEEDNVIQNAAHLDDFFEELLQLKVTTKGRLNIIHIGDSHIQADYLTEVVRRNFQHDFGNAGRGLVVPLRVAGTNEPANFRTSSSYSWKAKRCVTPDYPLPIGIGGVTISTQQPDAEFSIRVNNNAQSDYSFNAVTLFFQKDISSFHFALRDTSHKDVAFVGPYTEEPFVNYSRVVLPHYVDQISIKTLKTSDAQKQATIFGIDLDNGKDGIRYHAIGVNGAKYAHYNAALHFARQTQALEPTVFVISLGTNESIEYPYVNRAFINHVDELVQSLKQFNPQAKFVLVTPPDAFRRKVRPNPGIETIRNQIIQYAVENGLAFWDMYKAMGGKQSAGKWKTKALLRPDGIHFSKDGYEYQGNLFYHAIMKSYNNYFPLRHP
jgi:lysophospholipase L1-like esterase